MIFVVTLSAVMKLVLLLILLPATATVSAQFAPTLTVKCSVGPVYTFTLTAQSPDGIIFVDGRCAAKVTNEDTGIYTFDNAACQVTTNAIPALGTEFKVVVQQFTTLNLGTDYIANVKCVPDLATVIKTTAIETTGKNADDTKTGKVVPTFSIAFQNPATGDPVTTGTVGTEVKLVISIPVAEYDVFDYQVGGLTVAAGGTTVTMITNGCPDFASVIPKPGATEILNSKASLTITFKLFIPKDTKTDPSLGTTAASVTFTFTITVCSKPCGPAPTCADGRKRRSLTANNSTYDPMEIATTFLVYPAGHKIPSSSGATNDALLDDVCISRTPIIGVLVALSVALVVCLALTAVMFCKLRKPARKGDMSPYDNGGYKA